MTGIGSVVTSTSSSFSELDTYVLSAKKYEKTPYIEYISSIKAAYLHFNPVLRSNTYCCSH